MSWSLGKSYDGTTNVRMLLDVEQKPPFPIKALVEPNTSLLCLGLPILVPLDSGDAGFGGVFFPDWDPHLHGFDPVQGAGSACLYPGHGLR